MGRKFKEYAEENWNQKEKKEAVDFVKKYQPLMAEGDRSNFGLGEQPMELEEALTSRDAQVLMTTIMEETMQEAAEPLYIASQFFDQVQIDAGNRLIFPAIGALRAYIMSEGQEYREQSLNIMKKERRTEVSVSKKGLLVPITEEAIEDSQWEVVGMHVEAAGRAMARLKEELMFKAMTNHGTVVFDNDLRDKYPQAGTTGLDELGNFNDTLSVEDFFDLVIMLMNNEYVPTDLLIHPLTWTVFLKNGLIDMLDAPAIGQGNDLEDLQGGEAEIGGDKLPINLNVTSSPFIPFDEEERTFDMYCIDRNNVGVEVTRDPMTTDEFEDPYRDIQNLKFKERYGIGILDEGKAVTVAKNISLDTSYPKPDLVRTIDISEEAETDYYDKPERPDMS